MFKMGESPNMSDCNLLMTVEDMINISLGPSTENRVNFKMLQRVLHILARQLQMLETKVEIRQETVEFQPESEQGSPRKKNQRRLGDKKSNLEEGRRRGSRKGRKGRVSSLDSDFDITESVKQSEISEREGRRGKRDFTVTDRSKSIESRGQSKKVASSISITEQVRPRQSKVVRVGSIEVVPRSEFDSLRQVLMQLQKLASPIPAPTLPDNLQLRDNIVSGKANLTDTMQAMQVSARVEAAEQVIQRILSLLTSVVSSLSPELKEKTTLLLEQSPTVMKGGSETDIAAAIGRSGGIGGMGQGGIGGIGQHGIGGMGQGGIGGIGQHGIGGMGQGGIGGMGQDGLGGMGRGGIGAQVGIGSSGETGGRHHGGIGGQHQSGFGGGGIGLDHGGVGRKEEIELDGTSGKQVGGIQGFSSGGGGLGGGKHDEGYSGQVSNRTAINCVTQNDLDFALSSLQSQLMKLMSEVSNSSANAVETAVTNAQDLADKMAEAMSMEARVANISTLMDSYTQQLNGFDEGFATQMKSFENQVMVISDELLGGIQQMQEVNSNTETAAVLELTERYEALVLELDAANTTNAALHSYQASLQEQLRSLSGTVEILSSQKCDWDELVDSVRDKADSSRLSGLVSEGHFSELWDKLQQKVDGQRLVFDRLDEVWQGVIRDITAVSDNKAEAILLQSIKDQMEMDLQELTRKIDQLAAIVGEPYAAILTRQLSKDGNCGVCLVPALMGATGERPAAIGAEDTSWIPLPKETRTHFCHRWCGGSHTMMTSLRTHVTSLPGHVTSLKHQPLSPVGGYGDDGKMYLLERELQPCEECNPPANEP